jgi:histidinol-phosphatase (PHP family)
MSVLANLIDGHAHSQFSWDASEGCMLATCRRAAELGLGGIAFTEHADLTDWVIPQGTTIRPGWEQYLDGGTLRLPPLDVERYLASVEECRRRHPGLRILSGVEISEPHWHQAEVADLLARGRFDRVLSSVHAGPIQGGACEVFALFDQQPAGDVVCSYLAEVTQMVQSVDVRVLAHIDYAARYWPSDSGPFDAGEFEAEHRGVLEALAGSGGALEINTRLPLDRRILTWWVEAGGEAVTFGSDSHAPQTVGAGLRAAAELAGSLGFQPAAEPTDPWRHARR